VATFPDIDVAVQPPRLLEELQRLLKVHFVLSEPDTFAALARVGGSVRGAAGNVLSGLSRRHLELMPKIEICAIHGVGLETTDLPAVRERGVVITWAPVLFDDVADLAVALALACCRQIPRADRFVREGKWEPTRLTTGRELTGMHVGIVGLGRIGIELAHRLEGFKTTIGYFDSAPRDVPYQGYSDALTISQARPDFFVNTIIPQPSLRSTRLSPARKPRASRFAWASIPDRRNSATSSRAVYASYWRRQMLNCWRVAHCARSRPIARRSATEAAGVETSTRATAIVDIRRHISYTMRLRPRGKKAPALAR
jgi:hypothetical protein